MEEIVERLETEMQENNLMCFSESFYSQENLCGS
jgi:hypothetical protein